MTDEPTRNRLIGTMFGAVGLSTTAFIGLATIAPIVGATLTGSPTLAGIPNTLATVGTASGALVLGWAGARIGRRRSFAIGFTTAAMGALLALVALGSGSFWLFVAGAFVVGFGRSAAQLARYAAGDLRNESRRGAAISLIVWASTIGAVVGPLLIDPTGSWARAAGWTELAGPLGLAVVGFAMAALVIAVALRPDPLALAVDDDPAVDLDDVAHPGDLSLGSILRRPTVVLSFVALVVGQSVMVLVMTMTPVHIRSAGGDLGAVGWVMMAHTLGMFAIAPITGWLVDRGGPRRMILAGGFVLLASCLLASTADTAQASILIPALFGLGVGWNFGFVSASALLQRGLSIAERVRIQGVADATTWMSGGVGAGLSGVILGLWSYRVLALIGAGMTLVLFATLVVSRRRPITV
jgi:MFS family permease